MSEVVYEDVGAGDKRLYQIRLDFTAPLYARNTSATIESIKRIKPTELNLTCNAHRGGRR